MSNLAEVERRKYMNARAIPNYGEYSAALACLNEFLPLTSPDETVWDIGCGASITAAEMRDCGLEVVEVDHVNALKSDIEFKQANIWKFSGPRKDWVFCADVIEHIPEEKIDYTLLSITPLGRRFFFKICTVDDNFEKKIEENLHLTVKPPLWWHAKMNEFFYVKRISCEKDSVTIIAEPYTLDHITVLPNAKSEDIANNIRYSYSTGLPIVVRNLPHDEKLAICGSGPSLSCLAGEVRNLQSSGYHVWALGNAHKCLASAKVSIDGQVILDSRRENVDFICYYANEYFLSTQCDREVIDICSRHGKVLLWNGESTDKSPIPEGDLIVSGGMTVGISALALAYVLGYRHLELFGYDSSFNDDKRHAVYQAINDSQEVINIEIGERRFSTSPAMAAQAKLFTKFAKLLNENGVTIKVHGDGLLPYAASLMDKFGS